MKNYDHRKIEKKWQTAWEKSKIYEAKTGSKEKTFYGLIEFPYPSGAGLHVGHIRSNTAMDIITRKFRMGGYNVLYPIGWDAFGLPTENYAIKTGIQPAKVTKTNTDIFRKQLKSIGFGFDWSREINTTDPAYYKWTQWIFLQMFKKGLAYKHKTEINWCEKCKIGLANEEVVGGECERCGNPVVKKEKEQWMLAITKYADRLDKDLDEVNYLEKIKIQQRNWIGKSEGSEIDFSFCPCAKENIPNLKKIKVFTTRPDTIFGATYVVLAPEHELIKDIKSRITNWNEVNEYIKKTKKETEMERTVEDKIKTGIELKGVKAINPATKEEIPIWIADYVLATYGTGAVMAVPAHDERDFDFAKKYNLSIKMVIEPAFISRTGVDAIKNGFPIVHRNAIMAIVKHWSEDKYIGLKWKKVDWQTFITGGPEGEETPEEGAKTEIIEETGYLHPKLIKKLGKTHSNFFHVPKNLNRFAHFDVFYFELQDGEKKEISQNENDNHEVVWLSRDEIEKFALPSSQKYSWNELNDNLSAYCEDGFLSNSGKFNGMTSEQARKEITEFVGGKMVTKYKLRDWVFSRQRYWGEPIPIIHCDKCALNDPVGQGYIPVPEKDLPVVLPKVKSYIPTDNGESPLAIISKWVNTTCPKCKSKAKRETDTMPNWAGSSWYFLRYTDPKNKKEFASKKALAYWMKNGVDWYNGGMEHTTLHLLYSRFWHKFLYDLELVPTSEPYMRRTSHGMILSEGGDKMSKSKGNIINPDDIVKTYGADTLRIYEMFIGPFDQAVSWSTESIIGSRRFLERVWRLGEKVASSDTFSQVLGRGRTRGQTSSKKYTDSAPFITLLHKTIKKITEDIESMNFNTAISSMMILVNEMLARQSPDDGGEKSEVGKKDFKMFLQILAPFAPHITEELWQNLGEKNSVHLSSWPKWNKKKIIDEMIKIAIQVNGKVRTELMISKDMTEKSIKNMALIDKNIITWIENKEVKRIIYIPNRVINIVV